MRDYSLRYMDRLGRSGPSDFMKFADDASATKYARTGLASNAVVEVWKGSVLVIRLEQSEGEASLHAIADRPKAAGAADDADDKHRVLAETVNILPLHGYNRPIR